jgi:hypothetical protein
LNEEQKKTGGQGGHEGPEPVITGIREGVDAGYQALEYVLDGLRESLRIRRPSWTAWAQQRTGYPRDGGRATGAPAPGDQVHAAGYGVGGEGLSREVDNLVRMLAELLGSASAVAHEFAGFIADRTGQPSHVEHAHIALRGTPGKVAAGSFKVHNTASTRLAEVSFTATKLIGGKDHIIESGKVTFEPETIKNVRPGGSIETAIKVDVPGVPPDTYRGLISAAPGGAWAVVEVKVEPAKEEAVEARPEPAAEAEAARAEQAEAG